MSDDASADVRTVRLDSDSFNESVRLSWMQGEGHRVTSVDEGSTSKQQGIKIGDIVTNINDVDVRRVTEDDVLSLVTGSTTVTLKLLDSIEKERKSANTNPTVIKNASFDLHGFGESEKDTERGRSATAPLLKQLSTSVRDIRSRIRIPESLRAKSIMQMLPSHIPGMVKARKCRMEANSPSNSGEFSGEFVVQQSSKWIDVSQNMRTLPRTRETGVCATGDGIRTAESASSIRKELLEVQAMVPGTHIDNGFSRKKMLVKKLIQKQADADRQEAMQTRTWFEKKLYYWAVTWGAVRRWYLSVWDNFVFKLFRLKIWRSDISRLSAEHGRNVGVYFKFLRWALMLNIVLQSIWALFLIIPYSHQVGYGEANDVVLGGEEQGKSASDFFEGLVSGSGPFLSSPFFYGSYSLPIVPVDGLQSMWSLADGRSVPSYDYELAYWFTALFFVLISFVGIVVGLHWSIQSRHSAFRTLDYTEVMIETVFCGFNYSAFGSSSMSEQQIALSIDLQGYLKRIEVQDEELTLIARMMLWVKRIVINAIMVVLLILGMFAIDAAVNSYIESDNALEQLIPGLVLAILNAIVPPLFEALAIYEKWPNREFLENLNVIRASLLRYAGLYVFLFSTLAKAERERCPESFIGSAAYATFMVASMLFDVLASAGLDVVWYVTGTYITSAVGLPYFDTVKRVLELVYAQAIIWVGALFSPILPMLGIIRSVALFYIQSWSTLRWCKRKSHTASLNSSLETIIWGLLLFGMAVVLVPVGLGFSKLVPSGVYRGPDWQRDNFNVTMLSDVPVSACGQGDIFLDTCAKCLEAGQSSSTRVCWLPKNDDGSNFTMSVRGVNFEEGVGISLASMCAACNRGCGPFRNRPTFYGAIRERYNSWSDNTREIFLAIGSPAATLVVAAVGVVAVTIISARSNAKSTAIKHLELKYSVACEDVRMMALSAQQAGLVFLTEVEDRDNDGLLNEGERMSRSVVSKRRSRTSIMQHPDEDKPRQGSGSGLLQVAGI